MEFTTYGRYLVQPRDPRDSTAYGPLREWECIEVSNLAIKVQDKVREKGYSMSASTVDQPFWVLKDKIDTVGNKTYQIIETL